MIALKDGTRMKRIALVPKLQLGNSVTEALASRFKALCLKGVAHATVYLNRGLAPEGEILFFAPPKKSIQKKGGPIPLLSCAPRFCRGSAEGAPAPLLTCGIPAAPLTGYSRQKLRCSARHRGLGSVLLRDVHNGKSWSSGSIIR
jgi:hypothetical protein